MEPGRDLAQKIAEAVKMVTGSDRDRDEKSLDMYPMGQTGLKRKWYEGKQGTTGIDQMNLPFVIPFDTFMNRHCDRSRVFCKAVSNGRPFEPIDIMLGVQCM